VHCHWLAAQLRSGTALCVGLRVQNTCYAWRTMEEGGAAARSEEGLSDYEKLRLANIRRNEEQLRLLGLDIGGITSVACGRMAPTAATRRRRARPLRIPDGTERRSARNLGKAAPDYRELQVGESRGTVAAPSATASRSEQAVDPEAGAAEAEAGAAGDGGRPKRRKVKHSTEPRPKPASAKSCKNLVVDLERLANVHLGAVIPPLGGQVKRAAMEAAAGGAVTFSRMSGIQEWENCVALFINVYGEGYKNAFLSGGREVTWFAQPRQWEGTPVIQRMINCEGGEVIDDDGVAAMVEETPVILFCRCEGQGYVYCGRLGYRGHDPARIPVRFVWSLDEYETLQSCAPFQDLVRACNAALPNAGASGGP
jgi:hypothetical protein